MNKGLEILVVDDEALVGETIKLLLDHEEHKVCHVESGEAALAELAQRKFDLVITDFLMPGMQGDELVASIRQLAPAQPIIMVTAFINEFKVFGQSAGKPDAILLKPFSLTELRDAINRVLTRE
jgi:DNA-binding response OmpR family regulator